jgi:HEAT repeat protein
MSPEDRQKIERALRRKTLSHADFGLVERLGDDAFEVLKGALGPASAPVEKANGMRLLVRVGTTVSPSLGKPRLPEVFGLAADLISDPNPTVRATAIRIAGGSLSLMLKLGMSLDAVGGVRRTWNVLRTALGQVSAAGDRRTLETLMRNLEQHLGQSSDPG